MATSSFADRPHKILLLFDVDGTLTPAREDADPEMLEVLKEVRKKCVIGFVGGSDLVKQQEQLGVGGRNVTEDFDYVFSENGLTAYKLGKQLASQSFINFLGEDKYTELVNFILAYLSTMTGFKKRGTFIEFRNGMINVSPIGRNATIEERKAFEEADKVAGWRKTFVHVLRARFEPDANNPSSKRNLGLKYSIGGQISFDVFPQGWDKTYCLRHVRDEGFEEIHFYGDKTFEGGNDYEIFSHPGVIGHSVRSYHDTIDLLRDLLKKLQPVGK